jgi:hypothetical protein
MAVQQGYGKMAGTNSLVFAYDTGDTVNSYKGEPTTNLNTVTLSTLGTDGSGQSSVGTRTILFSNHVRIVDVNSNTRQSQLISGLTGGITYTISVEYKKLSGTPTFRFQIQDYSGGTYLRTIKFTNTTETGITDKDGWQTASWTFTLGADANAVRIFYQDGADYTTYTHSFELRNPQLEAKSHATPFAGVGGTRSATEGLIDLTGNTSIDLSNVSFDSNSQIDFDGTSDYIETSVITTDTPNITSISWVYLEDWASPNSTIGLSVDSGTANGGFRVYNTASNIGVWMRRSDTNSVSSISGNFRVPKKQWIQVAFVNNNGAGKIYINDHVAISGTFTSPGNVNGPAWVSRYSGGGYYLNGKVDNVLLFNKALTEAEIISNFKRNKKRHLGADALIDHTTDGGGWIRWWWYTGVGWPGHEPEALGHPFGTFDSSSHYGFQRLPEGLEKEQVELLAKDGDGNIYKWDFADGSGTAQYVWDSFTQGAQGVWANAGEFRPKVIEGAFHGGVQDTWQYRESEGVVSFLLDDDSCDCISTLNAGHAMCGGSGWNQQYAQPDGAYLRYGVDTLNDGGCRGPVPERTLELYYRLK